MNLVTTIIAAVVAGSGAAAITAWAMRPKTNAEAAKVWGETWGDLLHEVQSKAARTDQELAEARDEALADREKCSTDMRTMRERHDRDIKGLRRRIGALELFIRQSGGNPDLIGQEASDGK